MSSAESWGEQPFDAWDDSGDAGAFDELAELDEGNPFEEDSPHFDDGFDEFSFDAGSGLYMPHQADELLLSGSPALAFAQALNPFVLESLEADDVDEFFKRIARGIKRGIRAVGRVAGKGLRLAGRFAGPLLNRALPILQKVAGFAGPWGRLISAGIGAARGLAEGKGLKGALAGALSGAIPGIGGKLASAVLRADGADDDASLDALADLADAGYAHPAVAVPVAAGLATRVAARAGTGSAAAAATRPTERWMVRLAAAIRGSAGRRMRVFRSIGRLAAAILRRRPDAAQLRNALVMAVRSAAQQVLARIGNQPAAGASTRGAAQRRLAARRAVLRAAPSALYSRYPGLAAA
jgi:hypothetical protein